MSISAAREVSVRALSFQDPSAQPNLVRALPLTAHQICSPELNYPLMTYTHPLLAYPPASFHAIPRPHDITMVVVTFVACHFDRTYYVRPNRNNCIAEFINRFVPSRSHGMRLRFQAHHIHDIKRWIEEIWPGYVQMWRRWYQGQKGPPDGRQLINAALMFMQSRGLRRVNIGLPRQAVEEATWAGVKKVFEEVSCNRSIAGWLLLIYCD